MFQVVGNGLLDSTRIDKLGDLVGHLKVLRCYVLKRHIVEGEQAGQGVDGASVFQITDHGDGQAIDRTDLLANGEDVQKCLGGMFSNAIAGIDQWFPAEGSSTLKIRNTLLL